MNPIYTRQRMWHPSFLSSGRRRPEFERGAHRLLFSQGYLRKAELQKSQRLPSPDFTTGNNVRLRRTRERKVRKKRGERRSGGEREREKEKWSSTHQQ